MLSISSSPRSSAAKPRVMGLANSERCLSGATSISMAVTKATKLPTVVLWSALCSRATLITHDSATAAKTWVRGVMAEPAAVAFMDSLRKPSASTKNRSD